MNSSPGTAADQPLQVLSQDPAMLQALRRAHRRYWGWRPWYHHYAWCKYLLDPCYRAVASQIRPDSDTVDLGTGLGMLPVLLGLWGGERRCYGIEWDHKKVAYGQRASRGMDSVRIEGGDLRDCDIPACDAITLVDVLHYHPVADQQRILRRCVQALRPSGRLLIREADLTARGSSRWTRWVERASLRIGWNKGSAAYFRPLADLRIDLVALGLSVQELYLAGPLHPGNVLLMAERPAAAA